MHYERILVDMAFCVNTMFLKAIYSNMEILDKKNRVRISERDRAYFSRSMRAEFVL